MGHPGSTYRFFFLSSATVTLWQADRRLARSGASFTLVSDELSAKSPGVPLGAWLADSDDERLIRLLRLRPDLTQPPPGTIAALAARAAARQSVKAATDDLDFLHLAVLDALLTLHADTTAVTFTELAELFGDRADGADVRAAVDDLLERALVWGDVGAVRCGWSPKRREACPGTPGRPPSEDVTLSSAEITAAVDALDAAARTCWTNCSRARRSGGLATRCPVPRRIARCPAYYPPVCCAGSTTRR